MQFMVEGLRYKQQDEPFIDNLRPFHHQKKTLEVLRDALEQRQSVAIINTSVTGSGKTLANFASAILDKTRTIGVFPTNELIADQARSLYDHICTADVVKIDSVELDKLQCQYHVNSHIEALYRVIGTEWPPVISVLTNPDILYLAIYNLFGYGNRVLSYRDRVFQEMVNNFPILVFDEFHLYNAKQVGNVAFIVGTIARLAPNKPHIFVFSSATPRSIKPFLERLGMRFVDVTAEPESRGQIVCEPMTVELVPADLRRWEGLKAIEEKLPEIRVFADNHNARGAFIVDSVYDAKVLANRFISCYGQDNVGEVHGYMPREGRANALERRFSIGTTTIDAGVDLTGNKAKDFLVFEARTGEHFIQRLGRLGRCGREPDKITVPNRAWVFVPHYVFNYVRTNLENVEGNVIPRQEFLDIVCSAYTPREDFRRYLRRYSPLEAVAAVRRIRTQYLTDTIDEATDRLNQTVLDLYRDGSDQLSTEDINQIARGIGVDQQRIWTEFGETIERKSQNDGTIWQDVYLPALERFREGGDFLVALYDRLDKAAGLLPFKTYNLPFVLRRTEFCCLQRQRYEELVNEEQPDEASEILRHIYRSDPLGYLEVTRLITDEPNRFCFQILESRIEYRFEQIIKLKGFEISLDAPLSMRALNRAIKKRTLVCWICQSNPWPLAGHLNLPHLFELYPLQPVGVNRQPTIKGSWSIAFEQNAFLLDALAATDGDQAFIV